VNRAGIERALTALEEVTRQPRGIGA